MIRCSCPRCVKLDAREAWGAWQAALFADLPIMNTPTRKQRLKSLFELAGTALPFCAGGAK